jgi:hypothetical protein
VVLSCTDKLSLAPRHVCALLRVGACLPIGCTGQDVFDTLLPKNIALLKGEQYSICGTNHYPPDTGERHGHTGCVWEGGVWESYVTHQPPHILYQSVPHEQSTIALFKEVQGGGHVVVLNVPLWHGRHLCDGGPAAGTRHTGAHRDCG